MNWLQIAQQGVWWIVLCVQFVAFMAVLSWPRVKGKACLTVALLLLVGAGAYFRLLNAMFLLKGSVMSEEFYQLSRITTAFFAIMNLVGTVLLLVGLVQTISGLAPREAELELSHYDE